jgi:spore maturation protein CgeB
VRQVRKVLVVGEFKPSQSSYTYTRSFVRAFESLGLEVSQLNLRRSLVAPWCATSHQLPSILKWLNDRFINRKLRRVAASIKPDLIFVLKGENLTPRTLRVIKAKTGACCFNYFPDNPFVLWNGNSTGNLLKSLPLYDCFAIWARTLMPILESAGCSTVSYLPFGYDEEIFHKPVTISQVERDRHACDVCFVGTWEPEREWWLEALVAACPGINLALWGNLWAESLPANSSLREHLRGPAIYGPEMIKAMRCSKISLNFIRAQNATAHNMRTMEVPASGAFLLTQRTHEQAMDLFKEGESIACFSSPSDLCYKVKFYLEHKVERERIRRAGAQAVKQFALRPLLRQLLTDFFGPRAFTKQAREVQL